MLNFYMRAGLPHRQSARVQTAQKPVNIMNMYALDNDCFVKRPNVGIELSKEENIEKLFDETYNEVLLDSTYSNPVISEIKPARPYLKTSVWMAANEPASYNFADNEMTFSENYDEDLFIITAKDADGKTIHNKLSSPDNLDADVKAAQAQYGNRLQVLKLTPAEKDFRLKAAIAHELRHYIQNHLTACAEDTADMQFEKYREIFENAQNIQNKYIETCEKEGIQPDKALISMKMPDYWNKCCPEILLDNGASIKLSANKKDKRAILLKDIYKGLNDELMHGRNGGADAMARPSEADAYNYEYEYIRKFAPVSGIRQEAAECFAQEALAKSMECIDKMQKNGISFVQR